MLFSRFMEILAASLLILALGLTSRPVMAQQQNDAGSGGDAGNVRETALEVEPNKEYTGRTNSPADNVDTYKVYVYKGQNAKVIGNYTWTSPPTRAPFIQIQIMFPGLLYFPDVWQQPSGMYESEVRTADSSGYWEFTVICTDGALDYSFKIEVSGEPQPDQERPVNEISAPPPGGDYIIPLITALVVSLFAVGFVLFRRWRKGQEEIWGPEIPSLT